VSANVKMANQDFLAKFDPMTSSPELMQKAANAVNEYTRIYMREQGFLRVILPPVPLSAEEVDRTVTTDQPAKIVDKEPGQPPAVSVPFGTTPMGEYLHGSRYMVVMDRIQTPKFIKDVVELMTYTMDLRQVVSDNAIKDLQAEEDGKFILCINNQLVGQGSTVPATGTVQWKEITGGITRETLAEGMELLPSTPMHQETSVILMNNITSKKMYAWGRDEVGGDMSQEILQKGLVTRDLMGATLVVTIKSDLVPTNTVYYFTGPQALGKFYTIDDATIHVKREAFMLEFFGYECIGAAIGSVAGVARADYVAAAE